MFALLLYLKSWKILFAFPFYILSFYSYMGTNLILPLFTVIIVFYSWIINKKQSTRYYVTFVVLAFVLLLFYVVHLHNDLGGGRISQILNPDSAAIANEVNLNRKESVKTPFTDIFINRYSVSVRVFVSQYVGAFSPDYLFSSGEDYLLFTLKHGVFYAIDAIFLLLGFMALFIYKRKEFWLLLLLLLIAPIPSAIYFRGTEYLQYVLRSSFIFPLLLIIMGFGIYFVLIRFKDKRIALGILLIYVLSLVNFGYIYFFQNPVFNYDSFGISGRIFARYAALSGQKNLKLQFISDGWGLALFRQYLFFNNEYTRQNHSLIATDFLKPVIVFNNLIFTDCKNMKLDKNEITVMPFNLKCTNKMLSENIINITNFTDNKPIYVIYNDDVCKNYVLLPRLSNITLNDLNIEKLNEKQFCQKFFTRGSH